jgi:multidrug efflux pump subunit AcrB
MTADSYMPPAAPDREAERAIMRGPIGWMARNSIAANLLMVLLVAGGIVTAVTMQKEVFPEFALDTIRVDVGYPGAAPSEVEQGIVLPIEEAVRGIDGIREIVSRAREGSGRVTIELVAGTDRMKAFQDIDQAINRIRTFPDDIDQPEVTIQEERRQAVEVVLFGDVEPWSLRRLAEQVRDTLQSHPSITQVEVDNAPDYITHVEISQQRLREFGLTLDDVARTIGESSEDFSAGTVETSGGEILLRVNERRQWADEFARVEIIATDEGAVTLADIATIRDGFEEAGFQSQFNGTPSAALNIYRVGSQSPLEIAEAVRAVMADVEPTLPPGVNWRTDNDNAKDFRDRLDLLLQNGAMAVLIVLVILAIFLEFRLAFWVMAGMTISFIGGILFLPAADISLNMVTMFGFLVVLGIVVDDAIVVGENTYDARKRHRNPLIAAVVGAKEVAGPVTFAILTTVVAFIPLMFIRGETGKFWYPLPVVVIVVLLVSLIEALFILPAHLAHQRIGAPKREGVRRGLYEAQQAFSRALDWYVANPHRWVLEKCLRHRYITVTVAVAIFAVVGSYASSAHMGMIMMPEVAADEIEAGVRLPVGTTPDQAEEVATAVTAATLRMFKEHNLYEVAEGVKTNVRGGSFVDVEIVMRSPDEHDATAADVIRLWRDNIGDLPGVERITFEAERGPGGWRPDIAVDLSHTDESVLEAAAGSLVSRLEEFALTSDVDDNFNRGKTQYDFKLRPEARALGLTAEEVASQLRGAYFGTLALRQLRGTNEVEVRVKLPKADRKTMYHLDNYVLRTPTGAEVPLLEVVEIVQTEAFSTINRRDGRRTVTVSTDIEPKRAIGQMVTTLNAELLPELRAEFPGLTWTFQGSNAEMRRSTAALWGGFGMALVVMYGLLAIAFGSYFQPLIIFGAIPFGIVGAVIGHILLGFDLSLVSLMGVIALSGVVVNDSLIMIDFANKRRRDGDPAYAAILAAGLRRFRPILLTTVTTFGGLTPIILEQSTQAQYLIPMAISLGFGIVFATAIIMVLVPCLYLLLEDVKGLVTNGNGDDATGGDDVPA